MTDNIFGNPGEPQPAAQPQAPAQPPAQPAAPQEPAQVTDPNSVFANQLAGIKADDGRQKYADVNTALESIPHAQDHIKSQADEIAKLKEELQKRAGVDEVLKRIESNQEPASPPASSGLDETTVNALVEQTLNQREQAKVAEANQAKVVNALLEKYGDKAKAEEAFLEKAKQLGVDAGFLTEISLRSPEAALAYFETAPAPSTNPIFPGVNTANLPPKPEPESDFMKIYKGGEDHLVNKWRKVAK